MENKSNVLSSNHVHAALLTRAVPDDGVFDLWRLRGEASRGQPRGRGRHAPRKETHCSRPEHGIKTFCSRGSGGRNRRGRVAGSSAMRQMDQQRGMPANGHARTEERDDAGCCCLQEPRSYRIGRGKTIGKFVRPAQATPAHALATHASTDVICLEPHTRIHRIRHACLTAVECMARNRTRSTRNEACQDSNP